MTDRERQLIAAGYNPANHQAWMSLEYLLEAKAKAHEVHRKSLERYTPVASAAK